MVGVVSHERGKIERNGEACLTLLQQVLVALVRLFRGGEARELPHGPEPRPVHGRVWSARERIKTWKPDGVLVVGVRVGAVERSVEGLDLTSRNRRKGRISFRGRVVHIAPLLEPRLQLDELRFSLAYEGIQLGPAQDLPL